jgi:hypothetical protein
VFHRNRLTIARDVYGKHPDELTRAQMRYVREFIALALLEAEEMKEGRP